MLNFKTAKRSIKKTFLNLIGDLLTPTTFFVFLFFSMSLAWIPDGFIGLLKEIFNLPESITYIIQLIGGIFILIILFLIGNFLLKQRIPKIDSSWKDPRKRKAIIIFLSPNKIDLSNVKNLADLQKVKTPWQMPAVAIDYHLPELEYIFVILSSETKNQFDQFKSFLKTLFPNKDFQVIPVGLNEEIDFEDIEQVNKVVEELYEKIIKEYKLKEKDIIIDITGGKKIVSIVGAIQTFKHDREFQYVSTSDYKVKAFDVRYYED